MLGPKKTRVLFSKPLHVLGERAGACSGRRERGWRKEVRKRRLWLEKRKRSGGGSRLFEEEQGGVMLKHVQARWLIAGSEIELA
jgi:hypothetical protein